MARRLVAGGAPPFLELDVRGQHLFFATRDDLVPGLQTIESQWELEYQLHELRDDRSFVVFASLVDAPGLGMSGTGQSASDAGYLVYPRDARPAVRAIPQRRGGVKYDAELASEVVQFRPSGLHAASGALIAGRIARVVGANGRGIALYQAFSRALLGGFHPVRSYWVGPEAYRLFKTGRRLATIGVRSPPDYDLAETP